MFNRSLFNRTLFNRLQPLFRDYSQITLYGMRRGFEELRGLFEPHLNLQGIQLLKLEQLGQLIYTIDKEGSYRIFYDLEGEQILEIISGAEAKYIIELIGKVIKNGKN